MIRMSSRLVLAGTLVGAVVALGLYGTVRWAGNRPNPACTASTAILPRLTPTVRGEVAAFQVAERSEPAPALAFAGPDGGRTTVADFRGSTVLLNLWATWCEPCKREMPALDRLQAELGGASFKVVAVNIDTRNLERPRQWLREAGITSLTAYADSEARIFQVLRSAGETDGLPTTLLIGPDGCRLGRLAGRAEWASPDGQGLMRAALGR